MNRVTTLLALTLAALPLTALAGAKCEAHPKAEWIKDSDARAKLEEQGYKIRKFKIDGNCYEIYGWNKEGIRYLLFSKNAFKWLLAIIMENSYSFQEIGHWKNFYMLSDFYAFPLSKKR